MDAALNVALDAAEAIELDLLVEALYRRYRYDFRGYSRASLARRLAQARERFGCGSLSLLQDRLLHDPTVLPQLLAYLTVQVSEMFRDPDFFAALRREVVPLLGTYPSFKAWIAGCGTGEEAYSLAILLREEGLEARSLIYATDIQPDALRRAEAGVYPLDRLALYTENHRRSGARCSLSEYYAAAYDSARLDPSLRRRIVFSDHSLASDAVFAEVQLVLCRNVLIYFDRPLQDRAVGLFRAALVRGGFLGLGAKETLRFGAHAQAFVEHVPGQRIYRRRGDA
jgi:chemotaxis protein methyltransferase CheR